MNDRYLYRAKRKDNGEWVEGDLVHSVYKINDVCVGKYGSEVGMHQVDESTICQCTGLKDKNGKLIRENDVVDFLGHKGKVMYEFGSFGIAYRDYIDWEEIEANICPITGCDNALCACENDNFISLWEIYWNFNDEDDSINTLEVIGSSIDNPELLEVGE